MVAFAADVCFALGDVGCVALVRPRNLLRLRPPSVCVPAYRVCPWKYSPLLSLLIASPLWSCGPSVSSILTALIAPACSLRMEAQKSGYAYSVREGEASRSPLRKRSLSLRRFRSPPSNGGAADQSYTAAPSAKREQTAESVPPLPASTSASGRLEGGEASQTAQRKPLAKPRQTAAAGSTRTTHPPLPPAWPKEIKYQRCYCEEGAYLLAAQLELDLAARRSREGEAGEDESSKWEWEVWVVVVSNRDKTVS